jgi:hypothetical protein
MKRLTGIALRQQLNDVCHIYAVKANSIDTPCEGNIFTELCDTYEHIYILLKHMPLREVIQH